ncbi:MAG TPA: kelch repeat-containing protein [Pirellulales bacterium]|nr:kelch repeat-containing protein [Pirellulales bacterium]
MAGFQWTVIAAGDDGPGPRSRHGFAHDRQAMATVLVGGIVWERGELCSDTWELDEGGWHRIDGSPLPPARHRGGMVYDSHRGCCVLFGGQASNWSMLGDTWLYANRRWHQPRRGWFVSRPAPRCGHSLAFDEEEGVVVPFGGIAQGDRSLDDTWLFDGSKWRRIDGDAPPARRYAAFAYDLSLKGCILHGGSADGHGAWQFDDTWLFRDRRWTQLPFDTDCRDDHGVGYHFVASRLLMLEGLGAQRGLLVREPDGWHTAEVKPLHPRHQCAPLAWDATLNGLVLHGGEARHGGPQMGATLLLTQAPTEAPVRQ